MPPHVLFQPKGGDGGGKIATDPIASALLNNGQSAAALHEIEDYERRLQAPDQYATPGGRALTHRLQTGRISPHLMSMGEHLNRPRPRGVLAHRVGWLGPVLCAGVLAGAAMDSITETALAPHSGPRGATMFAPLPAELTGVLTENPYADPSMWAEHYQELAYGEIGTGVAIGDYDNDGRPDIFGVNKTGDSRLFRNLGNWKFADVTATAGLRDPASLWDKSTAWLKGSGGANGGAGAGVWQQGVTFVDVNNDGWLDLYICRIGAPNLLYINQGDGTFKEEAAARGLAVNDASGMAAFCDYDRDGWLDVYVQTNMLDAATHPNGQRGYLFHNNRDGTFSNVTVRAGITGETMSHSATWWDYDNDGWPDLYVANDYAAPDRLYHNNRDGTFTDMIDRVVPHMPYYAMGSDVGDVNNDGLIDLFVADMATTTHEKDQRGMVYSRVQAQLPPQDPQSAPQLMRSALYLNTGTGYCQEAAGLAGLEATDWTWSVRFEDLDNDGRLDLHVTNGMIREYHNVDLLGRIMAAEGPLDSRRIVRASPKLMETHLAFRNLGDLRFEEIGAAWGLNQKAVSFGAAFGDLDGDGDLDLVYGNYEGGVTVLRNDCDTGHRLVIALRGTQSNRFGVGATVRIESALGVQVRPLVLARGYLSSSEPVVHFGLGADTLVKRLTVAWPSGQTQSFTDLAVDRKLTITEPPAPAARPAPPVPPPAGQFTAVPPPRPPVAAAPLPAPSSDIRAAADFDQDGRLDCFTATRPAPGGYAPSRCALLAERGGALADVTDEFAPALRKIGRVTAALWSDVDGDGRPDLLVALEWGAVRYFHNRGGRGFEDWTEKAGFAAAGTGWWSAMASADFNGDGRPDYAVGNLGLNTRYHASPDQPAMLFYGDFGGPAPFAIEGYYEHGRLYPWWNRKELGAKVPAILKRYPRNDPYARATLAEILGEERLAAAQRWAATEFRSGVFLSQPDGTYRFEPLPRIAQIAPIQGLVAGDFDGDGRADLYAVQNAAAPVPSAGRFDGGLSQLLRGDGRGHFTPVPPAESNLLVPGEAKAVAVLDLDNDSWPDFLVTRNNAPALAFRNNGSAGRHSLRVDLHGPAGNPAAVGARLVLELADGTTQTCEVTAGLGEDRTLKAAGFFGYPDVNPPRRLRVRWPSSVITVRDVPPAATVLTLTAPL